MNIIHAQHVGTSLNGRTVTNGQLTGNIVDAWLCDRGTVYIVATDDGSMTIIHLNSDSAWNVAP